MINFENNMLVLNNVFSKEDVNQINEYTEHVRKEEQERIIKLLEESDSICNDWAIALIKNSGHTKDAS
jgi:hypothetical protein